MTAPRPARRWPLRCAAVAAVVLFLVLVARFDKMHHPNPQV